jgi:hypothetical protein
VATPTKRPKRSRNAKSTGDRVKEPGAGSSEAEKGSASTSGRTSAGEKRKHSLTEAKNTFLNNINMYLIINNYIFSMLACKTIERITYVKEFKTKKTKGAHSYCNKSVTRKYPAPAGEQSRKIDLLREMRRYMRLISDTRQHWLKLQLGGRAPTATLRL